MRVSRTGIIASVLPSVLMLGLFYSLALHMYQSLGAWPRSIGEEGFPPLLLAHANITTTYFMVLFPFCLFILPSAILVLSLVPTWRRFIPYFALCGLMFIVCWGLMQLAPDPFLYWWRD